MTKKDSNIKRIEEKLKILENEPLTWDCLDQLLNLFAEAMNVLGTIDFIRWAEKMDYTQSFIRNYFELRAMRKPFEGKVSPGMAHTILFLNWSIMTLDVL
jgi:hypothetical protein